jgi:hypothetical protein
MWPRLPHALGRVADPQQLKHVQYVLHLLLQQDYIPLVALRGTYHLRVVPACT